MTIVAWCTRSISSSLGCSPDPAFGTLEEASDGLGSFEEEAADGLGSLLGCSPDPALGTSEEAADGLGSFEEEEEAADCLGSLVEPVLAAFGSTEELRCFLCLISSNGNIPCFFVCH